MLATSGGHLEVVKYLVESGADVEATDNVSMNIHEITILT